MPKKKPMTFINAQAAATIPKPAKAMVILSRAAWVWVLSPPDKIHRMPPQTKKAKVKMAAMIIATWMPADKSLPMSLTPADGSRMVMLDWAKTCLISDIDTNYEKNSLICQLLRRGNRSAERAAKAGG